MKTHSVLLCNILTNKSCLRKFYHEKPFYHFERIFHKHEEEEKRRKRNGGRETEEEKQQNFFSLTKGALAPS